ncbi:bactofilin family protein [Thermospira aquatica]|uniref:Polymer-forming cytoskeletal protein n=1 Tax=Thermospira aquatica TaxID=2828656 RepID=A0AAX3BC71_9SPIR|nr:polymer-forming cytoskeletal protein [Thermospira aquatica]URA09852.1 polymer-forming cytoskeletal protein [Thermospira aquatica]
MAKDNLGPNIDESMVDTVLADDIDFQGTMRFNKSLMIKGRFEGKIEATGHLIVGPKAVINADVKAGVVTNYGQINGNVEGLERVELLHNAKLTGDIKTPDLIIETGCSFNGNCTMVPKQPSQTPQNQQTVKK